jgi:hypothetical protein
VAIQAEWTGGNAYAQRTANVLSGGGANGAFKFNSATVIDDNAIDTSSGDSGRDWFFARRTGGNTDVLTDRLSDELITDLL